MSSNDGKHRPSPPSERRRPAADRLNRRPRNPSPDDVADDPTLPPGATLEGVARSRRLADEETDPKMEAFPDVATVIYRDEEATTSPRHQAGHVSSAGMASPGQRHRPTAPRRDERQGQVSGNHSSAGMQRPQPNQVSGNHSSAGMQRPQPNQVSGNHSSAGMQRPQPSQVSGNYSSAGMQRPQPSQVSGNYSSAGMQRPQPSQVSGNHSSAGMQRPQPNQVSGELSSAGFVPPLGQSFGELSSPGFTSPHHNNQVGGEYSTPGFIPSEAFKSAKKGAEAKRDTSEVEMEMRIKYGLCGGAAGAVVGGVLGIVNAMLVGMTVTQGTPQILSLIVLLGLAVAGIAFYRPERLEELLIEYHVLDSSDRTPLPGRGSGASSGSPDETGDIEVS